MLKNIDFKNYGNNWFLKNLYFTEKLIILAEKKTAFIKKISILKVQSKFRRIYRK